MTAFFTVWDNRTKNSYATLKVSEDPISSMITNKDKRLLACTGADGTLFAIQIRNGSVQTESDVYESGFNCLGLFKQDTKLAVGNGEGKIILI
jgi:WD40 repeat protein